jgi:hypothetical protein
MANIYSDGYTSCPDLIVIEYMYVVLKYNMYSINI